MILLFAIENTINIVISILQYIVYDDICLMVRKINYFIYFILQREPEVAEMSAARTKQTERKNLVWFGETERKLAKLSMTTFT